MTEEELKKVFGKNIKQLRESKNIKQIDLAAKIGIAHTLAELKTVKISLKLLQ